MASNRARAFEPIYGWGWRQDDRPVEVPETLSLKIITESEAEVSGVVDLPEQYSGCMAELSLRSKALGTTQWNVVLSGQPPFVPITGFAQSSDDV